MHGTEQMMLDYMTAIEQRDKLEKALREAENYLDDRADVDDGRPNAAMRLLTDIRTLLAAIDKERGEELP